MPTSMHLVSGFKHSVDSFPSNIALEIEEQCLTYQELNSLACQLANQLNTYFLQEDQQYVGILSGRSLSAFRGVLASLFCGKAYLPFDLKANPERIKTIIDSAYCKVFIVDVAALDLLQQIENDLQASVFLFPHIKRCDAGIFSEKHTLVFSEEIEVQTKSFVFNNLQPDNLAYLLFTSGSTGKPKGVPISHKNICAYIQAMQTLYPLSENDRCTQAFDFTFDPSVHDMFVTWFNGACLCVMDDKARLGAQYFIKKRNITVWNTLPSIVKLCLQTRSFNESYLSNLKYVFFNGEPLLESVISTLQERTSKAKLINLYGLTETTVNLAHYCWDKTISPALCRNGIVPIGQVFPGITVHLSILNPDELELCLSGSQIFSGYLPISEEDRLKNKKLFFNIENSDTSDQKFMHTGDLVLLDENNLLHIVGRNDEQVKLSGHRVDLNFVRYILENVSKSVDALVLKSDNKVGDIQLLGFLKGMHFDKEELKLEMAKQLPSYMQLKEIYLIEEYPYLVSGKVDKKQLLEKFARNSD